MVRASITKRVLTFSACGLLTIAAGGCGGSDTPAPEVVEQNQSANQAAARAAAYGNANNPGAKGKAAKQPNSGGASKK